MEEMLNDLRARLGTIETHNSANAGDIAAAVKAVIAIGESLAHLRSELDAPPVSPSGAPAGGGGTLGDDKSGA